ncbi:MAG TPA: type II toxin-antitoxin system RelE/ParE family toxin [Candidatus Rifleibacterium sp.]|nr:type II toxin-antitoxin system RelE/ParE family toxin [Candidatus Rifleibacterium sp.]HPT45580.1 type II toxin-antitoxin system RelE/ParE family toxin [Candidatus Rifleibacterium sp.]
MYKLEFAAGVVKEMKKLGFVAQNMILDKLELFAGKAELFKSDIKALKGKFAGKFRLRIRNYRVIYQQDNNVLTILIVRVGHRKDVYK